MSFLLVGDNRSGNNWGGRASGLALFALLREGGGEGESILGTELLLQTGYGYHSSLFPPSKYWLARTLATSTSRHPLVRGVRTLDRWLGAGDFLTDDPAESARNIEQSRSDPDLRRLYERVAKADVVVINGEGDIVFGSPVRRQIRFFAAVVHLAGRLKKRIAFVNTMLSDCSKTGRNPAAFAMIRDALGQCDLVTVRDARSFTLAREEMGISRCRLVPDSVFHWYDTQKDARARLPGNGDFIIPHPEREEYLHRLRLDRDYICVGGNSMVTQPGCREDLLAFYRRLCAALRTLGYPIYLVVSDGPDGFLEEIGREMSLPVIPILTPIHFAAASLGRARLFISGRYHPTIMAALGGTPSIYLETNAHKMRSLADLLEDDAGAVFPAAPDDPTLRRLCQVASARLEEGSALRTRIQAAAAARAQETDQLSAMVGDLDPSGRESPPAQNRAAPVPASKDGNTVQNWEREHV